MRLGPLGIVLAGVGGREGDNGVGVPLSIARNVENVSEALFFSYDVVEDS